MNMKQCNQQAKEWLEYIHADGETNHHKLSRYLVSAGDWFPPSHSFGKIHFVNGHQRGLDLEEFIDFTFMSGFFWGMVLTDPTIQDLFEFFFKQYIAEHGLEDEYNLIQIGRSN